MVTAISQAAVANWSAAADAVHDGTGVEESYFTGTAYIFDATKMEQSALFALWDAGTTIDDKITGYVGQSSVSGGALSGANWSYGEQGDGKTYSYYFALVDGTEKIYLSNIVGEKPNGSGSSKTIGFGDQYDWAMGGDFESPNSWALPTEGYVGEGFWAASAVPEPTSGLLLLLGVAGLALRRRRA